MGGNEDQRHVVRRDYLEAFRLLTERDTQFQRRVYVYVACAFIESETWMMKQMALEKASGAAGMPPDEASACREIRYYVRESGVVASAPAFQSFVPGIRFAFRVAYRWHFPGRVWNEHKHDIGWTELRRLYDLRSRLVHPKADETQSVSDAELAEAGRAVRFFVRLTAEFIDPWVRVAEAADALVRSAGELPDTAELRELLAALGDAAASPSVGPEHTPTAAPLPTEQRGAPAPSDNQEKSNDESPE